MTIRKGQAWGSEGPSDPEMPVAEDDAGLARLVFERLSRGQLSPEEQATDNQATDNQLLAQSKLGAKPPFMVRVRSGDLLETVGGNRGRNEVGDGRSGGKASGNKISQFLPMDLGVTTLDSGVEHPFVAHTVAKSSFWRGECAVIMNAAWVGDWYLGTRAHPNDGLLDITVGSLGFRDRVVARQRVKAGTHLPHPDLRLLRSGSWSHDFGRQVQICLDGNVVGRSKSIAVRIASDAFVLVI